MLFGLCCYILNLLVLLEPGSRCPHGTWVVLYEEFCVWLEVGDEIVDLRCFNRIKVADVQGIPSIYLSVKDVHNGYMYISFSDVVSRDIAFKKIKSILLSENRYNS